MSKIYPHVVIRYIPGIYGQCSVRFVDPGTSCADTERFVIPCVLPFVDGKLTLEARQSLIKAAIAESKKSSFKLCVVFGAADCVYCEPTGDTEESDGPPQGGIRAIKFPLQTASNADSADKPDMESELFIVPRGNSEYPKPPKSKEEYLKDLELESDLNEKVKSLRAIIEIHRAETIQREGKCADAGCSDVINLLKTYGQGANLEEKAAEMLLQEGAYCEKAGDFVHALKFYESSLTYEIKDEKHRYFRLNNLAFCLNFFNRFEEAESYLRQAVELSPQRYNAWKNLGVSLEHQCQIEEAAEAYYQAVLMSDGESRSVLHLRRLVRRYPVLKQIPAMEGFA